MSPREAQTPNFLVRERIDELAQYEAAGLLRLSPAPRADWGAAELRRITAARTAAAKAGAELDAAVRAARAKGDSWEVIGAALGMSAQAAWKRFGHPPGRPQKRLSTR